MDQIVEKPKRKRVCSQRRQLQRLVAIRSLVLYDVTSSYPEGRCYPLAAFGYNRDGKKGKE